jgi:hypothetical protein
MKLNPSLALIGIYIVVTAILQFAGFLVSRVVDMIDPTLSLMAFLILFLGMFWLGWPIALRIAEALVPGVKTDPAKPGP